MASVAIRRFDLESGKGTEGKVDSSPFGARFLVKTLRDAVLMYEANARQGTADTRERGDVRGTTKKPWKQKHTGRARAGSKKSPLWRKGGTVFGPHPRDYSYRLPKKELRVALRTALFGKLRDGEVTLVKGLLGFDAPSSKRARGFLGALGVEGKTLVVLPRPDRNAWLSFRNFRDLTVRTCEDVNAYDVCRSRNFVCDEAAWTRLAERVGAPATTEAEAPAPASPAPAKRAKPARAAKPAGRAPAAKAKAKKKEGKS